MKKLYQGVANVLVTVLWLAGALTLLGLFLSPLIGGYRLYDWQFQLRHGRGGAAYLQDPGAASAFSMSLWFLIMSGVITFWTGRRLRAWNAASPAQRKRSPFIGFRPIFLRRVVFGAGLILALCLVLMVWSLRLHMYLDGDRLHLHGYIHDRQLDLSRVESIELRIGNKGQLNVGFSGNAILPVDLRLSDFDAGLILTHLPLGLQECSLDVFFTAGPDAGPRLRREMQRAMQHSSRSLPPACQGAIIARP